MKVPTSFQRGRLDFNMTPMIDVVFLLIIFFLVSSHLAQQEVQQELDLPEATTGIEPPDGPAPRVTLNVMPDGQILLAGHSLGAEQLTGRLVSEAAKHSGHLEVRIRGDRSVAYRNVSPILKACAAAGIWDVKFAVIEDTGE
jgi:biopolymer transport protein ExbD